MSLDNALLILGARAGVKKALRRGAHDGMKKAPGGASSGKLAEEEGFEPSLPGLRVKRFSRPPHSTTLPPLRIG